MSVADVSVATAAAAVHAGSTVVGEGAEIAPCETGAEGTGGLPVTDAAVRVSTTAS